MTAHKSYNAYTLIEMLIVLAIFVIIASIGFSSFYGMKDAITMNEKVLSISQEFRDTQRAALFLERNQGDKWIYGVGIDFSSTKTDGKFRLFKWCSQFPEYGNARTRSDFPNFDESINVSSQNGNLPVPQSIDDYAENCNLGSNSTELSKLPESGDRSIPGFIVDLPTSNDATGDGASWPAYILFESVSGRAFMYDTAGNIINYNSEGEVVSSPIDFKIYIQSDRTKTRKTITVSNISGKVDVKNEKIQ